MSRTTTTVDLKVNARELQKLDRVLGKTFDPARAKALSEAAGDLNKSFEQAAGAARGMASALEQAASTASDFSKLKQQLAAVRQEARRVRQELGAIGGVGAGATSAGGGGGGGGGSGGRGGGGFDWGRASDRAMGDPDTAGRGRKALSHGIEAIPRLGLAAAGVMLLGGALYSSYQRAARSRRDTYAARTPLGGSGRGRMPGLATGGGLHEITGTGITYGLSEAETHPMYGQMAAARGGPLSGQAFGFGMAAKYGMGVDLGTTGGLMKGLSRAGNMGGAAQRRGIATMIGQALALGLDGSEVNKYLQDISQLVGQQAEIGQRQLDMTAFREAERALGGEVGGYQAQRIIRGFAQGVSEIGYKGAGGATEFMLATAAGYRPGQGQDSYFAALQRMQDVGSNPQLLEGYLGRFMGGDDQGIHTRTAMIQRALQGIPGMGNVHQDTARRIAGGDRGAIREITMGVSDITEGGARGVAGDLQVEAGFEARRVRAGAEMAPAMQSLTDVTITVGEAFTSLAPAIEGAAWTMKGLVTAVSGVVGALGWFKDTLVGSSGDAVDAAVEVRRETGTNSAAVNTGMMTLEQERLWRRR